MDSGTAVDIVGPIQSDPPYWPFCLIGADSQAVYERLGGTSKPEGKSHVARSVRRSPTPTKSRLSRLVAQGANDPRVNRREAEQIIIALRDRGFPVEYLLAPDEGHAFARPIHITISEANRKKDSQERLSLRERCRILTPTYVALSSAPLLAAIVAGAVPVPEVAPAAQRDAAPLAALRLAVVVARC